MTVSFVAVMFLTPKELGTINSVLLAVPYLAFIHVGVFNGLGRNLAFYKAQNENEKVQKLVNASFSVAKWNSLIGVIIGVGVLINFIMDDLTQIYIFSSMLLIVNLTFTPFTSHFDVTYRSGQHFKKLGQILMVQNSLYLLSGALPYLIGYLGRIISVATRITLMFSLRYWYHPYKVNGKGRWKEIKELMKVGVPLFISTYLWGVLVISDQTLIAHLLGAEALGHYALSTTLMTAMIIIPQSLNVLLYPKAAGKYGQTKSNKGLKPFYWKALLLNVAMLSVICPIVYLIIEPLTIMIIPQYVEGIPAAKINILTCLTMISNGPSVIIAVTRRNTALIIAYAVTLGIIWLGGFMIPPDHLSLESIAWLRFSASALLCIFTLLYSYYLTSLDDFRE